MFLVLLLLLLLLLLLVPLLVEGVANEKMCTVPLSLEQARYVVCVGGYQKEVRGRGKLEGVVVGMVEGEGREHERYE